ncbi:MAG: NADH-quinone oxidoreductase subunit K, partial [bacterium]|nr:NADH-quinone oxidoreductase subunit K [bacterium]
MNSYLLIAAALFCLGILAGTTRRNAGSVLRGVELILNAAKINLVAFAR